MGTGDGSGGVDLSRDEGWPKEERYGLTSQARRAACSIAANMAEGLGRESQPSFICNSSGSPRASYKELKTHLLLAERASITSNVAVAPLLEQAESVGKLLRLLVRKLSAN